MIWLALALGLVGLALSAFFSGSETGFYRLTRLRLAMDALGGDRIARGLSWLTDHPSLFVATTLIGNNLANYITTLAVVMGAETLWRGYVAQFVAPLVLAPLLFVYGELLPKNLFFQAPNRLLRAGGPAFLAFAVLFAPVSALVWLFSKLLEKVAGESPQRVKLTLARNELQQVLEEGHEAGLLRRAQRQLAQGLFAVASRPITEFTTAVHRFPRVDRRASKAEILRVARRYGLAALPVEQTNGRSRLVGYVRTIDLCLQDDDEVRTIRPLLEIRDSESHIGALMQMRNRGESLARVVNARGETVGLVTAANLSEPLFRGGR